MDLLASVAQKADRGTLKTNGSIRDQYGDYFEAVADFVKEHPLAIIVLAIIGVVSGVMGIIAFFK